MGLDIRLPIGGLFICTRTCYSRFTAFLETATSTIARWINVNLGWGVVSWLSV